VRNAITSYNTSASITALPCVSTPKARPISDGTTGTHAKMITLVQLGMKNILYAVGLDNKLYQIDNNSLILQDIAPLGKAQVQALAGVDSHLYVLTSQPSANKTTSYALNILSAGQTKFDSSMAIDPKYLTNGQMPTLLAASGADVYVLFTSGSSQTSAFLLDYAPAGKNHQLAVMAQTSFSASTAIVSMAAFPLHQVFLLLADGSVKSVLALSGAQDTTSVLLKDPINPPLPVDAKTYTGQMAVPTVTAAGSTALSVPGTTSSSSLAVGTLADSPLPHLYIMDVALHRVLDLKAATGGTTPPVTAVAATSTTAGGGLVNGPPTRLQVVKQYASSSVLAQMKSITVDSPNAQVDVLTQNSPSTLSLTSFSVAQQNGCS
jgi:hypothetical protein